MSNATDRPSRIDRRRFLSQTGRLALGLGVAPGLAALLSGCEGMGDIATMGSDIAASTGFISKTQAESIGKSARAVERGFTDITPEQEYYIGRTVGAVILQKYPPYTNDPANRYVNVMGRSLALASDLPETYGGYHFLILDSEEINALSAPGGFIFITRGLLRCCKNEDAVAAVLAHEVGHVQYRHGLQAIKKSRITEALTTIGMESAKQFGGETLANLTNAFEGSISDITQTMINSGYSRAFEYQADTAAAFIMKRVGYNTDGLTDMLTVMGQQLQPGRLDFAKTHPAPQNRIAELKKSNLVSGAPVPATPSRQSRFQRAMRSV